MSTPPPHENYTSNFLELEPIGHQPDRTVSASDMGLAKDVNAEAWDVDKEINSLFDLISSPARPAWSAPDPATTQLAEQQLLQRITATEVLLAETQEKNQASAVSIQANIDRARQVQAKTEKLARYTKQQVQHIQEMLNYFEQVRQDIVTALDQFGDFQQLKPMIQQMDQSEQALARAHEQLQTYQSNLYGSLQQVQERIETRSTSADNLLQQHQTNLADLLTRVKADREQLAAMQGEVTEQIQLSTALRDHLLEQSKFIQQNITDINHNFSNLAESVQHEKQQFYQLTAEMINKADATRSKFAEIAKQVNKDWEAIQSLKFEMEDLRKGFDTEAKVQFQRLNQRYDEVVSTWGDIKKKQNHLDQRQRLHQTWLIGVTSGMGVLLLGIIVLLLK